MSYEPHEVSTRTVIDAPIYTSLVTSAEICACGKMVYSGSFVRRQKDGEKIVSCPSCYVAPGY